MGPLDPLERLLDSKSAAALLDIPAATLAVWRNREMGPPYIKIGASVRYRLKDLNEWIRALKLHFRPPPQGVWKGLSDETVDRILSQLDRRDEQERRLREGGYE